MAVPLWRQYRSLSREDREAIFKDPDRLDRINRFRDGELSREDLVALFAEDERKVRERYRELAGADDDGADARTPNDAVQQFVNDRYDGFQGPESQRVANAINVSTQAEVDNAVGLMRDTMQRQANEVWQNTPVNLRRGRQPEQVTDNMAVNEILRRLG